LQIGFAQRAVKEENQTKMTTFFELYDVEAIMGYFDNF